jgi:hypothetical protein
MSSMHIPHRRARALCAVLLALGCSERTPRTITEDGVPVVVHPARHGSAATHVLEDRVVRDIGGLKERSEDEFAHTNGWLTGILRSDGGLAVIDEYRVRLFDGSGVQVAVVGRQGWGPGEFVQLSSICRATDDRVIVLDQTRRVTEIDASGSIRQQTSLPELASMSDGCFEDGSFLLETIPTKLQTEVSESPAVRLRVDGTMVDTIGTFPSYGFRGISQYVRLHVHGRFVYVSDPRRSEVRRYTSDGTLERILRTEDSPRRMPAREAQRWLGGPVAAAGSGTTRNERAPNVAEVTWPFYRDLHIDASGRVWIRDFPEDDEAPDRYAIYDSTFAFVGRVDVPRVPARDAPDQPAGAARKRIGFAPKIVDAIGDEVVLLERDADGAAHFVTRRLRPRDD